MNSFAQMNSFTQFALLFSIVALIFVLIRRTKATPQPVVLEGVVLPSEEQSEQATWESLCKKHCPECNAENTIVITAQGGCAYNLQCTACQTRYWHGGPMPVAYKI